MSDAEPPAASDDAESAGGFASFLNSTPKMIGAITALIGVIGRVIDAEGLAAGNIGIRVGSGDG